LQNKLRSCVEHDVAHAGPYPLPRSRRGVTSNRRGDTSTAYLRGRRRRSRSGGCRDGQHMRHTVAAALEHTEPLCCERRHVRQHSGATAPTAATADATTTAATAAPTAPAAAAAATTAAAPTAATADATTTATTTRRVHTPQHLQSRALAPDYRRDVAQGARVTCRVRRDVLCESSRHVSACRAPKHSTHPTQPDNNRTTNTARVSVYERNAQTQAEAALTESTRTQRTHT
jgi:hypothetical protein